MISSKEINYIGYSYSNEASLNFLIVSAWRKKEVWHYICTIKSLKSAFLLLREKMGHYSYSEFLCVWVSSFHVLMSYLFFILSFLFFLFRKKIIQGVKLAIFLFMGHAQQGSESGPSPIFFFFDAFPLFSLFNPLLHRRQS